MTNGDQEGWIFQSRPQTNNGFFFLLTTKKLICIGKNMNILNTLRCDIVVKFYHYPDVTDRRAADVRQLVVLSFPRAGTGM